MRTFAPLLLIVGLFVGGIQQAAAEIKIGFVNRSLILEKAPQAAKAKSDLEKKFQPRDKTIVADQKKLKKLQQQYNKEAPTMGATQRKRLETKILQKKRDIKRDTEEFREDFNIARNELIAKLQKQVISAIKSIAKSDGYDLILIDGVGVLYHSKRVDITSSVLARLKKM
ncbi:MAG: OmpH family outer membrane protein [Methylococcales bacterium]|nr:OmpH family outer membrane protein [Methylococcales bacterium]MBT7443853.1 OmpH family outer membrane protein [Methylococcales bacterium]